MSSIDMRTIARKYYRKLLENNPEKKNNFITFRYMLPFKIPIINGGRLLIENISYLCIHKKHTYYVNEDLGINLEMKRTMIEATLLISRNEMKSIQSDKGASIGYIKDELSIIFDKQLNMLNRYNQTLNNMYQQLNLYDLSLGDIIGTPVFQLYNLKDEKVEIKHEALFILNDGDYIAEKNEQVLSENQLNKAINSYYNFKDDAFFMSVLYGRKSERAFHREDYNSAIVYMQTSLEIFLQNFIIECYTRLGWKNQKKINNLREDPQFKNNITQHMFDILERLKLPNYKLINQLLKEYLDKNYLYRNEIIHAGKFFTVKEAKDTLTIVLDLTYLITHDMRRSPSNDFVNYYKSLFKNQDKNYINDISRRYNIK